VGVGGVGGVGAQGLLVANLAAEELLEAS